MKHALKTPGEQALLSQENVSKLIDFFDVDTQANSSFQAILNLRISHKAETCLSVLRGEQPPPPPDLTQYAPLSAEAQIRLAEYTNTMLQRSAPPGIIYVAGKRTFDTQWMSKGYTPTDLPPDHPDHSPF